ncbi:hypothetical protein ABT336_24095 [Micromonospora sp. NPDC000207]|uniref:hypothetical protein n=1 Tax=Micromonospora sp. NPDC000207 TaxID=3154246 RepID=UPI0033250539
MSWHARPIKPNHGKQIVSGDFESESWLAAITIWSGGEAELEAARLDDGRIVAKHYDLSTLDDLDTLLNELVALLTEDRIPEVAIVVAHEPTAPA